MSSWSDEVCWICHSGAEEEALERPCPCPRVVHRTCMGRWQLQSAGRSEECQCRFCGHALPPLKEMLTPAHLRDTNVVAYMAVIYNGQVDFQCASPTSGEQLTLTGIECFNAAATCAAISAAKRAAGEDGGFEWHDNTAAA